MANAKEMQEKAEMEKFIRKRMFDDKIKQYLKVLENTPDEWNVETILHLFSEDFKTWLYLKETTAVSTKDYSKAADVKKATDFFREFVKSEFGGF